MKIMFFYLWFEDYEELLDSFMPTEEDIAYNDFYNQEAKRRAMRVTRVYIRGEKSG
jgi:hypothetical protein